MAIFPTQPLVKGLLYAKALRSSMTVAEKKLWKQSATTGRAGSFRESP
ncbi:hypothetical protein HYZ99_04800 [Candidatus Peregrinibacteria bacterium]|nr:hypothetical protein [Candidatus Peregrinibacteria bacterium]